MIPAFFNWSGGKDSSLALWKIQQEKKFSVQALLTSINAHHNRISMHGVRRSLLEQQAQALQLPLQTLELPEHPSMDEYAAIMQNGVHALKNKGMHHAIFGDIFLEDLRIYREKQLATQSVEAVFPLWKIDTAQLMTEFLNAGFKAITVCVSENKLGPEFCGRIIDAEFCKQLPPDVDICGENGEYHSFVFDGPIFKHPIPFRLGELVQRNYPAPDENTKPYGFYFQDLLDN
ncbi:MAG: ATP-binding protein [Bacteroidia bacterium]